VAVGASSVDGGARGVIQAPKTVLESCATNSAIANGPPSNRLLPNKPRGVRCVNDRRVLNGIFWVKQCRRVATRYDKLAANYLAFVKLASIQIQLRASQGIRELNFTARWLRT
jgi:hypothetical protein